MTSSVKIEDFEKIFKNILTEPEFDKNLYIFFHNLSSILLCWKNRESSIGWAQACTDSEGHQLFTKKEADAVEDIFEDAGPILEKMFAQKQHGGGDITDTLREFAANYLKPEDISLDRTYRRFTDYMARLDDQNRQLARQIGPVALISSLKIDPSIPLPFPPFRLQVPANAILPLFNAIIEILRLLFTFAFPIDGMRKLLTIFQTLLDVSRGEWKHGVLTFIGFFGQMPLVIGIALKVVRDAWLLISPQIREQLQDDIFRASKSFFAGFLLWIFATFSPDFIRAPFETALIPIRKIVDGINATIDNLEEQAKVSARTLQLDVEFPRIPESSVPSFADIQQIQRIIQQPEIFCNPTVRTALQPFISIPPIRLALELMNIPMDPESQAMQCAHIDADASLSDSILRRMKPVVKPLQE
jgi:hypothetical protein